MQERWKSTALWLSLFALISFILKDWLGIELPKLDVFFDLLLGLLTAFGILNNPTDKNHF